MKLDRRLLEKLEAQAAVTLRHDRTAEEMTDAELEGLARDAAVRHRCTWYPMDRSPTDEELHRLIEEAKKAEKSGKTRAKPAERR